MTAIRAIIALAAIMLPAAALCAPDGHRSAGDAPTEQGQSSRAANREKNNTEKTALRVEVIESKEDTDRRHAREKAAEQNQNEDREAQQLASRLSLAQAVFALVGMFIIVLTLLYTARAANAAHKSAEHANSALVHAADAVTMSRRSAEAAESALVLANEQFHTVSRPWIVMQPAAGLAKDSDDPLNRERADWATLYVQFQNVGPLPALDVHSYVIARWARPGETLDWGEPVLEPSLASNLAPGGHGQSDYTYVRSRLVNDACTGSVDIVLWAYCKYRNAATGEWHVNSSHHIAKPNKNFAEMIAEGEGQFRFLALAGGVMT